MTDEVKQQHSFIGVGKNKDKIISNSHPEAQWFLSGGNLGLFIHYGLSTVSARVDLSWGMIKNPISEERTGLKTLTPNEYFAQAKEFNPTKYNPEKWISAIADAGFTYAVLTTRHHDGFSLWPSEYGEFSTKNYMGGRDLVGEYIEACRKYNIKVGLYYSPPDWYFNRRYMSFGYRGHNVNTRVEENLGLDHEPVGNIPEMPDGFEKSYVDYVNGQIKELITRWGKIDLLWFDGSINNPDDAISIEDIRKIQPHILINPRLHSECTKGATGDFETYECRLPETKPQCPWEHCHIWPNQFAGWAYMDGYNYKSKEWFMDTLDKVTEWEGNFLINVGPRKDGLMSPVFYEALEEVKPYIKNYKSK